MSIEKLSNEEAANLHTSRALNDAELLKGDANYIVDSSQAESRLEITARQYEQLHQEMEMVLGRNILTTKNLENNIVEIKVEQPTHEKTATGDIGYEFEIESETRYLVEPGDEKDYEWKNHVIDTYDQSGRARIRIKNGQARLSLKVPLFTQDTDTSKTCLRLEFKPNNEEQEKDLLTIQELILKEAGAQTSEKWGAPLMMTNGTKGWINRDNRNNWWVELDEGVEFAPPEQVKVIGVKKSSVKAV